MIDLEAPDRMALQAALADVDVVINAAGAEDPELVTTITSHGVAFVDITATTGYVVALERLAPVAPVLVDVGLAPGLTNLLAAAVHETAPGPIDVAVFAGAGEQHGAGGVDWIYGLLGRRFPDPATGKAVRNYTQPAHSIYPATARAGSTAPTSPTSTRSPATSRCRCAPTSASTPGRPLQRWRC